MKATSALALLAAALPTASRCAVSAAAAAAAAASDAADAGDNRRSKSLRGARAAASSSSSLPSRAAQELVQVSHETCWLIETNGGPPYPPGEGPTFRPITCTSAFLGTCNMTVAAEYCAPAEGPADQHGTEGSTSFVIWEDTSGTYPQGCTWFYAPCSYQ